MVLGSRAVARSIGVHQVGIYVEVVIGIENPGIIDGLRRRLLRAGIEVPSKKDQNDEQISHM